MTITTEQFLAINTGTEANDGSGDTLRAAFIKVNGNFSNIADVGMDTGNLVCQGQFAISSSATPASATAAGTAGQIVWDANYIYVCIATNTWKRASIGTWV